MDMMCVCVCVCRQKARQTTNENAGTTVLVGGPQVRDVASREWVCVVCVRKRERVCVLPCCHAV